MEGTNSNDSVDPIRKQYQERYKIHIANFGDSFCSAMSITCIYEEHMCSFEITNNTIIWNSK